MKTFRSIAIALGLAACGSPSTPAAHAPAPVPAIVATDMLGLGEITVRSENQDVFQIHANGDVQFATNQGLQKVGKLEVSGKLTTVDNRVAQLQPDGSLTTPTGPEPFKLDGAALVAGPNRLTIENGKMVGVGGPDVIVTGADTDLKKRSALLIFGIVLVEAQSPADRNGSGAGPAPAEAPVSAPAPGK